MSADPGVFLSTMILASAGLVAIVGGLLVAKFVDLDTDELSNRRVLTDATQPAAEAGSAKPKRWLRASAGSADSHSMLRKGVAIMTEQSTSSQRLRHGEGGDS